MTARLSPAEVADMFVDIRHNLRTATGEPMTLLQRLSARLYSGGWSNLSDRVLDVRGEYRLATLAHCGAPYKRARAHDALRVLAAGIQPVHCRTCGEPEGSVYAKRCCTPDSMEED